MIPVYSHDSSMLSPSHLWNLIGDTAMKKLFTSFAAALISSLLLFSAAASADDCTKQTSSDKKTAGEIWDESYND